MPKALTNDEFIRRSDIIHNHRYIYSETVYRGYRSDVDIICPKHGAFTQRAVYHLNGYGCPLCESKALTTKEFIRRSKLIHGDEYRYDNTRFTGWNNKVEIICQKHGPFLQTPRIHLQGCGCPVCALSSDSGIDRAFYERLMSVFGEDDVVKQYKSEEYPFYCDFFVKSRELYIELRHFWTHGGHPYNPDDPLDRAAAKDWREKNQESYHGAVSAWTVRDPKRRLQAEKCGLNFLEFWDPDFKDFDGWVNAGCPDGHDYDRMYSWIPLPEVRIPRRMRKIVYDPNESALRTDGEKAILFYVPMCVPARQNFQRFYFPTRTEAYRFHVAHRNTFLPQRTVLDKDQAVSRLVMTKNRIGKLS